MSRILRIELRRSAAAGAGLILLVACAALLYSLPDRWSTGWMELALYQRENLMVLFPLTLAAGGWQARREQRSKVGELVSSTPRPSAQRVVPVLGALAICAVGAYLLATAIAVPRIIDTAHYLPTASLAVLGVGALSLIAAAWAGLGLGRLISSPVTAPAMAVLGIGILVASPSIFRDKQWYAVLFSPFWGMGYFYDWVTVDGRLSAAQALWLAGLAAAGVVLAAASSRAGRASAVLVLMVGAAAGVAVVPRGANWVENPIDPVARELVCAPGTPRVCVARVHEALLPEVTGQTRKALALLAKLPAPPTEALEDTTAFGETRQPGSPGVVRLSFEVGGNGHIARSDDFVQQVLRLALGYDVGCEGGPGETVVRAASSWLAGRTPAPSPDTIDEPPDINAEATALWQGLRKLPESEALARVGEVRTAAIECKDVDGLLTR